MSESVTPTTPTESVSLSPAAQAAQEITKKMEGRPESPTSGSEGVPPLEEKSAEPSKEEPKKEELASARFLAAAKREKEVIRKMQEAKAKETELTERESKVKAFEQARANAKMNPDAALEYLGLTYEDLTNYYLNDKKPTPDAELSEVRKEMKTLRDELLEKESKKTEEEKRLAETEHQKVITDFKKNIFDFVASEPDTYELIRMNEAEDIVYETILAHFEKTKEAGEPKILSLKEAADLVESYFEGDMDKISKAKKFQSKWKQEAPKEAEKDPKPAQSSPTLNNSMSSSAASSLPAKTEEDRMKRAMARLSGAHL